MKKPSQNLIIRNSTAELQADSVIRKFLTTGADDALTWADASTRMYSYFPLISISYTYYILLDLP